MCKAKDGILYLFTECICMLLQSFGDLGIVFLLIVENLTTNGHRLITLIPAQVGKDTLCKKIRFVLVFRYFILLYYYVFIRSNITWITIEGNLKIILEYLEKNRKKVNNHFSFSYQKINFHFFHLN